MLKRQDTALSSSRRVMSVPPPPNDHLHHAKSVGCMSGIFHLLSRHRHRRKFLTFGKKHEKVVQYPPSTKHDHTIPKVMSPTDQTETRTSSHSPEVGFRSSHNNSAGSTYTNSISLEERKKLKFELEKCDKDLKELKMIIESIRYSDVDRSPSVVVKRTVVDQKCGGRRDENIKYSSMNEHTSPVSVLDELTRAPFKSTIYSGETTIKNGDHMPTSKLKKGMPRKMDEANFESFFVQRVMIESVQAEREAAISPPSRSSKAMIESVEEVCKDIAWGEKREVGRLGLVIQDYICRDLIEEFVKDLGHSYNSGNFYSLPFQACKRKLCF